MAVRTDGDVTTSEFTHFVSIDFGTSGCRVAIMIKDTPNEIRLFTAWEGMNADAICPTVLLLDPSAQFVSFGRKAKIAYETQNLPDSDKANDYLLFHKFKIHLYDKPVRVVCFVVNFMYLCSAMLMPLYHVNWYNYP